MHVQNYEIKISNTTNGRLVAGTNGSRSPTKQLTGKQWQNEIEHWKEIPSEGKLYYIATVTPGNNI
jgi:hypothetical protein